MTGVVLAVINLRWVNELAAAAAERSSASVALIDGGGRLVAGSADQQPLVGKRFADNDLAKRMLSGDKGTMTIPGFDGVQRIFAYVRVPWTQARLAVGLDEAAVHSAIDRKINIAYLQLVLFGLFVLAARLVRRRAADRASDQIGGAHRDALRSWRPAGARDAGAVGRRIRPARGGA